MISSTVQRPELPQLALEPTLQEVLNCIKQILSGKAPGKDAIPPEVYKYGGYKLVKKLYASKYGGQFVSLRTTRMLPSNIYIRIIIISLLSIAGKILARLILNRIIKHLVDDIYPESQCGFRSGRGTIDMIFSLRQVAEKVREKNQERYMVFVDLTKAFDAVNREALWQVLKKLGIPENMLNVIISFHQGIKANVVSDGMTSEPFNVTNGTKQGCVMAPVLFALFFSVMLEYAFADIDSGVKFQFRTTGGLFNHQRFKAKSRLRARIIRDLLFADDAALVDTSVEEAQQLLERFSVACKAFGLTISIKKTEVIHQPPPTPKQIRGIKQKPPVHNFSETPLRVEGHALNYVKIFTYLGSKINSSGCLDDEIIHRIAKAASAFGSSATVFGMKGESD